MPAADREARFSRRLKEVTRYAYERAPFYRTQMGRGGISSSTSCGRSKISRSQVPVVDQAGTARRAGSEPAVRRLPVRPRVRGFPCSRHLVARPGRPTAFAIGRNDWHAIANAHARDHVGDGNPARRHGLHCGDFQPLYGIVGQRLRVRSGCARKALPVWGRRRRHDGARAQWLQPDEADGVLRHADLCAASGRSRAKTKAIDPRDFGLRDHVFFR